MKKSLVYLALLLLTGLCMAACGNNSVHELTSPSPTVVSGSAVSESQKDKGRGSSEIKIKTPYDEDEEDDDDSDYGGSKATFIEITASYREQIHELDFCFFSGSIPEIDRRLGDLSGMYRY